MNNKTLEYENKHLIDSREAIEKNIGDKLDSVIEKEEEIYEINNYVWKNLSSLNSDIDLIEQDFLESEALGKHNLVLQNINKMTALKKAYHNAYFGRIDFNNDPIYVGITSVEDNGTFYVYDWRSPISSIFYNYSELGRCSYETSEGRIDGNLSLKRQYKIEDDKIIRCFDSSLNIEDEYLQEILVENRNKKMTNIVNTIQTDQNKIIRNTKDNVLVVEGCAGSGKTSVALHHVAYLLYENKDLNSNNILILSPNNMFSKYISNVLPDLGERNVLNTTFTDFILEYVDEFEVVENYSDFLERIYNSAYDENIKTKLNKNIIKELDEFIKFYSKGLAFNHGFAYKKFKFTKNQLSNYVKNKCNNLNITEKFDKLFDRLNGFLKLKTQKEIDMIKQLLKNISNRNFDIVSIYNDFIDYENNMGHSFKKVNNKFLSYEDSILVLYLKFELFSYPKDVYIKHVVIDEAQDYSVLQYLMLKKIFYKSNFTIVGDVNQTINIYNKFDSLNELKDVFDDIKYITLNKTYRSSKEIIDYSNKILGINNVCTIQKNNNIPVKIINNKDIYNELLKDLKELNDKYVCIITKDRESSACLYNKLLKDNIKCSIYDQVYKENNKVVVMPSYMSKGLEFENVIIYGNNYNDSEKYLYYVVCTRAQSRLIIYQN